MVGESEVSVVLTLNTAVNELISLNLHLSAFSDVREEGYQRFCFELDKDEDSFEIIITFFDDRVQFVDYVDHSEEYADTYALYSDANHRHLDDEQARKLLREQFYSFVSTYFQKKADKLAQANS